MLKRSCFTLRCTKTVNITPARVELLCSVNETPKRIVNVANAGQIDLYGDYAEQISTDIGGPEHAVDGDTGTSSCTHGTARPWWNINLRDTYNVGSVNITFPDQGGDICNYRRFRFITTSPHDHDHDHSKDSLPSHG